MREAIRMSIEVNDFSSVDFQSLNCPMITIYKGPTDYPGKYVGRVFNVRMDKQVEAHPYAVVKDTYDELRKVIPFGFVKIAPSKNDDPKIMEIWL